VDRARSSLSLLSITRSQAVWRQLGRILRFPGDCSLGKQSAREQPRHPIRLRGNAKHRPERSRC